MPASKNMVILLGNLGQDPELKDINGTPLCTMSVATNETWTKDGQKQERVTWHRVKVWGRNAENCAKYLAKGRQVLVEGKIRTETYEKDGEKRYATDIVASDVQFISGGSQQPNQPQGGGGPAYEPNIGDDGIPF